MFLEEEFSQKTANNLQEAIKLDKQLRYPVGHNYPVHLLPNLQDAFHNFIYESASLANVEIGNRLPILDKELFFNSDVYFAHDKYADDLTKMLGLETFCMFSYGIYFSNDGPELHVKRDYNWNYRNVSKGQHWIIYPNGEFYCFRESYFDDDGKPSYTKYLL